MGLEAISSTGASEIFTWTSTLQEYQEQEPQLVVDIHLY